MLREERRGRALLLLPGLRPCSLVAFLLGGITPLFVGGGARGGKGFAVPVPGGRLFREAAFREALPARYCPAGYIACHTGKEREAA